ncbi:MAG: DUF4388 domain-containing protein [Chlorobi bacterium]|nr:DUF4388 domain-containing protein [Chlorobiota bacterium]
MYIKEKLAPLKFKGNIERIPLRSITDYISFTCILNAESGNDTGALFLKDGNLIDAVLNNDYHINNAKEILNWTKGSFFYQKWNSEFELDYKELRNILHFIEISAISAEINFNFNNKPAKIVCSEGAIVEIEPLPEDIKLFFNTIIKDTEKKDIVKIKYNKVGQTGDLKEYFSEIIHSEKIKKSKKTIPKNSTKININIIKQSFTQLQDDLGDTFISGSVYSADNGESVYSLKTNQTVVFAKFHKSINNLFLKSKFEKKNSFYLLDLKNNYLLFILIFKNHHIALIFNKTKIKLGYLLSILKPLLINDYKKSINN